MSTPPPRRRPRLVVSLIVLGAAALALGRVPGMESWIGVCASVSLVLVLVLVALFLAVREMVTRPPTKSTPRQ